MWANLRFPLNVQKPSVLASGGTLLTRDSASGLRWKLLQTLITGSSGRRPHSCTGWSKINGYPVLFWDNFGNSAPILTILSLLQAEIYGALT